MNIRSLPDDCLVEIFARIPLVDQMRHLPLVCRRWSFVLLLACRHIKSLALIGYHHDLANCPNTFGQILKEVNYKHSSHHFVQAHGNIISRIHLKNHLKLRTNECFTRDVCTRLLSKLPNIARLELIHILLPKHIAQVVQLLRGLANKLIDLKVFYTQQSCGPDGKMLKYNKRVNNCVYRLMSQLSPTTQPLLRRCTLDVRTRGMLENTSRNTVNLTHLTELHLTNVLTHINMFRAIFNHNSTFESLQKLTIESYGEFTVEQAVAQTLFPRLTHLTVNSKISKCDSTKTLQLINEHCSLKLRYLHVRTFNNSLQYFVHHIRNLASHLVHLRVDFVYSIYVNENPPLDPFWDNDSIDWSAWHSPSLTAEDISNLPIFTSITTLHLCTSGLMHTSRITSACSILARLFPCLVSLVLNPFDYLRGNCALCKTVYLKVPYSTSHMCKQKMVQSLQNAFGDRLKSVAVEIETCQQAFRQRFENCYLDSNQDNKTFSD